MAILAVRSSASPGERLRTLLAGVAEALGDRAVLWRGPDLAGADVDLLVTAGGAEELFRVLAEEGLRSAPEDYGHTVWTGSELPPIDVLDAGSWPVYYPSLQGLLSRLSPGRAMPPSSSPEDLLLILAAEAVAGKPLDKVLRRAEPALATTGLRLAAVAAAEGMSPLGALIGEPQDLRRLERRGRLPYGPAAGLAIRSPAARAALGARLSGRLGHFRGRLAPARDRTGGDALLIALSGMDGAGKSTAANALKDRLEASGIPAEIAWARIGGESALLDRLALPVKRLLRRQGTVADPVAAGGPAIQKVRDPGEAIGRRRLVSWAWIVIVAGANAGSYRRAAARRRAGTTLVCDRWATDALVDLELRYGRHRVARAILRHLPPRPDLAILLEIDAATAGARKPGDQAGWVLVEMERLYDTEGDASGLERVDARLPRDAVRERLSDLLDSAVTKRRNK